MLNNIEAVCPAVCNLFDATDEINKLAGGQILAAFSNTDENVHRTGDDASCKVQSPYDPAGDKVLRNTRLGNSANDLKSCVGFRVETQVLFRKTQVGRIVALINVSRFLVNANNKYDPTGACVTVSSGSPQMTARFGVLDARVIG